MDASPEQMAPEQMARRFASMEARLRRSRNLTLSLAALLLAGAGIAWTGRGEATDRTDGILRVRGLIVEDAAGRPRIVLGAPTANIAGRARQDVLTGIAYLDESGADRITIGALPDPMTAQGIRPRRTGGAGLLIHGTDGVERGGYSVLDDGTALLTIDWPGTGEGVAVSANDRFAGVGIFHRSPPGLYREAVTIGAIRENEEGFVKLTDSEGSQRVRLQLREAGTPLLMTYDAAGRRLSARPVP